MAQKTFDFFDVEPAEKKTRIGLSKKRRRIKHRRQLGFEFIQPKRESWPFCQFCRVKRAATQRWVIGHGTALKPAIFKGKPICQECFGRSEDEVPLTIDDFAERRNDTGYEAEGFSWSSDED